MRTVIIMALALCCSCTARAGFGMTPSGNVGLSWGNNVSNFGDDGAFADQSWKNQGYTLKSRRQGWTSLNPDLKLGELCTELGKGYSVIHLAVDGGPTGEGICASLFQHDHAGELAARDTLNVYLQSGWTTADIAVFETDDGWGIFLLGQRSGSGIDRFFVPCSPIGTAVFDNSCFSGNRLNTSWNKAGFALGNPGAIDSGSENREGTALYNAKKFWGRLSGTESEGKKRWVGKADDDLYDGLAGNAYLESRGNGDIRLAPTCHVELAMLQDGTVYGELRFDTEMKTNTGTLSASGYGDCRVLDSFWMDNTVLAFNYTACNNNCGCVVTLTGAMDQSGHQLDGDAVGPNGDPFSHEVNPSLSVKFDQFGAFPDASGKTLVYWVTRMERTRSFSILGDGAEIARVPAHGSLGPRFYEIAVPGNFSALQVLEAVDTPFPDATRPFRISGSRPHDYGALVALDGIGTNCEPGCQQQDSCLAPGGCHPPPRDTVVTDVVFLSPRPDLLSAADSVITWLTAHGLTSQKIVLVDGSATTVRAAIRPIGIKALSAHRSRMPSFFIIGDESVVNTRQWSDSTGTCQAPYCSGDNPSCDLDGDGNPDVTLSRIAARTSAEAQNQCATSLAWIRTVWQAHKIERSCRMVGDKPGPTCAGLSQTVQTAMDSVALVETSQNIGGVTLYDSFYPDCMDMQIREHATYSTVNAGVTRIGGIGFTDKLRGPGYFMEVAGQPYFSLDSLTTPQPIVGIFPSCGFGNADSSDGIPRMLMNGNVTHTTSAAAWVGPHDGGQELCEEKFYLTLLQQLTTPSNWCFQVAALNTIRALWTQSSACHEYLRTIMVYGFPTPMPGMAVTEVPAPSATATSGLVSVGPTPSSRGDIAIAYRIARQNVVSLTVFDISGRLIASLVPHSQVQTAGLHTVHWNSRDDRGKPVPAGIYFCRLSVAGNSDAERLVVLR